MASLFKPTYTVPLVEGAEVVTRPHKGKPRRYVRLAVNGKATFYPLTKRGDGYLVPVAKWYGSYADADGTPQRVPPVGEQGRRAADAGRVGPQGRTGEGGDHRHL